MLGLDVGLGTISAQLSSEGTISISAQSQTPAPTPPTQNSSPLLPADQGVNSTDQAPTNDEQSNVLNFESAEPTSNLIEPIDGTFGESQVNGNRTYLIFRNEGNAFKSTRARKRCSPSKSKRSRLIFRWSRFVRLIYELMD
jgi:hypothetical protein